jgi:hypothetical protein
MAVNTAALKEAAQASEGLIGQTFSKAWAATKSLLTLGKEAGAVGAEYGKVAATKAGDKLKLANEHVASHISKNNGHWGKALKGIASERPVTAALATTTAAGGTLWAGKQILGGHTQREQGRRSQSDNRQR